MGYFFHFSSLYPAPYIGLYTYVLAYLNFKAVLALPKMAHSAQTHKSISFIWIVWSTLYVYLWQYNQNKKKNCRFYFKTFRPRWQNEHVWSLENSVSVSFLLYKVLTMRLPKSFFLFWAVFWHLSTYIFRKT